MDSVPKKPIHSFYFQNQRNQKMKKGRILTAQLNEGNKNAILLFVSKIFLTKHQIIQSISTTMIIINERKCSITKPEQLSCKDPNKQYFL